MAEIVQHNGVLDILSSIFAIYKSKNINEVKIDGGKKGDLKNELSKNDIDNLRKYAQYVADKDKSQYYIHVEAQANFPENENLQGKFDLFYNPVNIRVEAATDDLAKKIRVLLNSSFIFSSLLDLLKSVDDW